MADATIKYNDITAKYLSYSNQNVMDTENNTITKTRHWFRDSDAQNKLQAFNTVGTSTTLVSLNSGTQIQFKDPGLANTTTSAATTLGSIYWSGKTDWVKIFAECPTSADECNLVIQLGDDNSNKTSFRNNDGTEVGYITANGAIGFSGVATLSGGLTIKGESSATADASKTKITFIPEDTNKSGYLWYSDYDSYQAPASLTFGGSQGGEYFIAPNIKATNKIIAQNIIAAMTLTANKTVTLKGDESTTNVTGLIMNASDNTLRASIGFLGNTDGTNTTTKLQLSTSYGDICLAPAGNVKITKNITYLPINGGIYWNPYVESTSDASDAASITVRNDISGWGTVLQISQQNDATDIVNIITPATTGLKHNLNTVWDSGNDGSGSGLDADTLDGTEGAEFLKRSETFTLDGHALTIKW